MRQRFENMLAEIARTTSDLEVRVHVVSTVRMVLQHCCYGALEWIVSRKPTVDAQPDTTILKGLREPTDGTLVEVLEQLLFYCERLGWLGVAALPYRAISRPSACKRLIEGHSATLDGLLRSLVAIRNDGGEGHGLPGDYDREAELSALQEVVDGLGPFMPVEDIQTGRLTIGPADKPAALTILHVPDNTPLLIRKIKPTAGQNIRISAQRRTGLNAREELVYEAPDPFLLLSSSPLPTFDIWPDGWKPFVCLQDRLTDTFAGRSAELDRLREWTDDQDSRTCLVYGDGGLGKTTLVVEFLHRWLGSDVATEWKPTCVIFYTAKRWRWGLDGLEVLKPGRPHMLDLIAQVHCLLFSYYPAIDWYKLDASAAIQKLSDKVRNELKLTRDDILIVVDNAETLIESEQDREQLGKEVKELGRRLARVIVTSRRREYVEATPIELSALSYVEGANLLRERGKRLRLRAIGSASDAQLLDAVKQLECRPLVLDALLRAMADPSTNTLAKAIQRVNQMLSKDLGNFLFDDAWQRLDRELKHLLLLMTRVADVHDSTLFRICSDLVGLPVGRAETALEESGGIASVSHRDGEWQIQFSGNFLKFAQSRSVATPDGRTLPEQGDVDKAKARYGEFMRNTRSFIGDRIPQAFRHPLARAARQAAQTGQIDEAKKYYEQAVLEDANNGWLFDRYAIFLHQSLRNSESALGRAQRATELLPNEGEVWFTRGMLEARLGMRTRFEDSLAKAESRGTTRVRCALQLAWGYTRARPPQLSLIKQQLDSARVANSGSRYEMKNLEEIARIEARLSELERRA